MFTTATPMPSPWAGGARGVSYRATREEEAMADREWVLLNPGPANTSRTVREALVMPDLCHTRMLRSPGPTGSRPGR
jgi:hypothetical protein